MRTRWAVAIAVLLSEMFLPSNVRADWQSTLAARFDYVDTFDGIADWMPSTHSAKISIQSNPAEFTAFSGRSIQWQAYDVVGDIDPGSYAIADHGASYRWTSGSANNASAHKSLRIHYNMWQPISRAKDHPVTVQYPNGVQRLAFQTHYWAAQAPDQGYETAYVFYMAKFPHGFFNTDGATGFGGGAPFVKNHEVLVGFNTVTRWGTSEERQIFSESTPCGGSGSCSDSRWCDEYGFNYTIFNFVVGNASCNYSARIGGWTRFPQIGNDCNIDNSTDQNPCDTSNRTLLGSALYGNEWVGIETRTTLSNPHGTANGVVEMWVYNTSGSVIWYNKIANYITIKDRNDGHVFNHKINKFQLGGNRSDTRTYDAYLHWGSHDGASSSTVLSDSTANFDEVDHVVQGQGSSYPNWIWNITDMSSCRVASHTGTTVTCVSPLTGGTNNEFRAGDKYRVAHDVGPVEWYVVDDVIVDGGVGCTPSASGGCIGPTYFSLLAGGTGDGRTFTKGTSGGRTITKGVSGGRTLSW